MASGWLDPVLDPGRNGQKFGFGQRPNGTTSVTCRRPWVSVPVLSKVTHRLTFAAASITAPPFISSPRRAPPTWPRRWRPGPR
jgi:hypothetical protein